jgi:replication factor C subunit 3/5
MTSIPWMEAYRPKNFEDIVLDPLNKKILNNIIETSYFPNLLFYGPPGTGKTTTIINLINAYQIKLNIKNKNLIIHLNASDDRGIDIIRNQINSFVNSKPLFNNGMKFIILDEVDYMTKNAQQALRYLLQNYSNKIRFCLICNYISKIDEGLQTEFIRLRFNQLPKNDIIYFLQNISKKENLNVSNETLNSIQTFYKSDIRSMINFLQSNQEIIKNKSNKNYQIIINNDTWDKFLKKIKNNNGLKNIISFLYKISLDFNIDKKNIIKDFLNYIIHNHQKYLTSDFLYFVENLLHSQIQNNNIYINYALTRLLHFISEKSEDNETKS